MVVGKKASKHRNAMAARHREQDRRDPGAGDRVREQVANRGTRRLEYHREQIECKSTVKESKAPGTPPGNTPHHRERVKHIIHHYTIPYHRRREPRTNIGTNTKAHAAPQHGNMLSIYADTVPGVNLSQGHIRKETRYPVRYHSIGTLEYQ